MAEPELSAGGVGDGVAKRSREAAERFGDVHPSSHRRHCHAVAAQVLLIACKTSARPSKRASKCKAKKNLKYPRAAQGGILRFFYRGASPARARRKATGFLAIIHQPQPQPNLYPTPTQPQPNPNSTTTQTLPNNAEGATKVPRSYRSCRRSAGREGRKWPPNDSKSIISRDS